MEKNIFSNSFGEDQKIIYNAHNVAVKLEDAT
jgi:hypothetical protein